MTWPFTPADGVRGYSYFGNAIDKSLDKIESRPIVLDTDPIPEGYMLTFDMDGRKILTRVEGGE